MFEYLDAKYTVKRGVGKWHHSAVIIKNIRTVAVHSEFIGVPDINTLVTCSGWQPGTPRGLPGTHVQDAACNLRQSRAQFLYDGTQLEVDQASQPEQQG